MAEKTCEMCGQVWDTRKHGQCPTCQQIIQEDLRVERATEFQVESQRMNEREIVRELIDDVLHEADRSERRASAIETFATLIAAFGILGGVILAIVGFESSTGDGLLIAVGLGSVLVWLLMRALAVGFAARMTLAAAEARLRASRVVK